LYAVNNGAVVVACVGNSGASTPEYPAGYSEVIAVGAVDSNYNVPDWSNRKPDVVAPGVDVLTTNIGGGYVYGSGTSLATPHVSGVVAIIQALRLSAGMGKLSPGDVESLLKSTAVDLGSPGYDEASGYGLVDAYNATLRALDAVVVTVTTTVTTTQTVTETLVYTTTRVSTTTQATTAAATVTKTTTATSLVTLTTTQLLTTTETATTTATQPPETTTITSNNHYDPAPNHHRDSNSMGDHNIHQREDRDNHGEGDLHHHGNNSQDTSRDHSHRSTRSTNRGPCGISID